MPELTGRIVGTLWTVVAALTIAGAILVSIIRLMLPQIGEQRDAIEIWLNEITNRPVQIGQVTASWRGWAPTVDVKDLVLLSANGKAELARFDYAAIDIAPLTSLWQLHLVPRRLLVGGMRIALERDLNGQISIAGMPPSRWPVARWIVEQRNFTLRDANITFTDAARDFEPMHFSDVTLSITQDAQQQIIRGSLRRVGRIDETYEFGLRATGDILGSAWDGDLFIDVQNAEPGPTLALAGWTANPIADGQLNARIWSRWHASKLQRAAIDLNASALRLAGHTTPSIDTLNATGLAIRLADGWSLDFDKLQIQSTNEPAPESSGSIRWRENAGQVPTVAFRANNLNLADAMPLLQVTNGVKQPMVTELIDLRPRASVDEIIGAFAHTSKGIRQYFISASVNDLSFTGSDRFPGVRGLDFTVRANNNGGTVDPTQTDGVVLHSDRWLVQPVEIQKMSGEILWENSQNGLNVSTDGLEIRAESIDFATRGKVAVGHDGSPHLRLVTRIFSGDVSRFHTLVPKDLLRPRGERWLRTAFRAGRFNPSGVVVHGYLDDFPFDNKSGTLKAVFEVADVDLKYSSKWPMTSAITASIMVDGRRVETSIHSGRVYQAIVENASIEMPDLFSREPMVRLRGKIRVQPEDLGRFIAESPLHNTKAARYSDVAITGEFDLTLDMNLGLYPGADKDILGLAHFSDNRVHSKRQAITLEELTGDISFTRQDWYGEGMTAVFDGDPVGVIFNGGLDDPNYDTEFRMTGTSDASQLFKYLKRYAPVLHSWLTPAELDTPITGRLPWKAVLTIPEASSDGISAPTRLTLQSSLIGLDVDLPWPFGKTSAEQKPLSIRTATSHNGNSQTRVDFGSTIDMEIDQIRRADGTKETQRVEIVLGEDRPVFERQSGLTMRGRIARLPLNEWIAFAKAAASSANNSGVELPISFKVDIDNLETLGRNFEGVNLVGAKRQATWKVDISSAQALGTIIIPYGHPEQSLDLDFERLWLEKVDPENRTARVDPRAIPPLNLKCESLRFGNVDLGSVELVTTRSEHGLNLERLAASQAKFKLQGDGDWLLQNDIHQSRINLTVHDETLTGLLKRFDYEVANIDGGTTEIGIEAIWSGMPSAFTLDKLHGSFRLKVDKGRFLDINPGSGRLFGLLSLQTLPRRLSLDFNDLFKKGFTFDSIEGAFELDHGNAYTNSLLMNGPSASIDIAGRTGLADQDYDQRVTVTPALSNTIPVASALFGPAGIGVGAVIFLGQKMFKSIPERVDKFLSREYSITGGWEQPVIERI